MKPLRRWWRRLCGSLRARDGELAAELAAHLEMQTQDNIRSGMDPAAARRAAVLTFGGVERVKEHYRDQRGLPWLQDSWADLRYAARTLRRSSGFAFVAVLTLALGIGANTAVFSLVNGILLHPPGVTDPERIVVVRTRYDKLGLTFEAAAPPALAALREAPDVFDHAAAVRSRSYTYAGPTHAEQLPAAAVTAEWFDVFGARPAIGRAFTTGEMQPPARVAVLSHGAWIRMFGGDPRAVGRRIELERVPFEIVGVMGRDFAEPRGVDLWVPLGLPPQQTSPQNWFNENLAVFGRTREDVPFARADAWLRRLASGVLDQAPPAVRDRVIDAGWSLSAAPFVDTRAGATRIPVLILSGAVGLVLLIACANIAGLMLARTSARGQELAVRAALGAGRARLLRPVFAEGLLVAIAGGVGGVLVAGVGGRLLLQLAPQGAASGLEARLDSWVLLFAAVVTVIAGLLFGLAPVWDIARLDPQRSLKGGGRTPSGAQPRLRSGLVVVEAALALVLLVGAGLFLRSLAQLQRVDPGFQAQGVVAASYTLPQAGYPTADAITGFGRAVLDRLRQTPGIIAASMGRPIPFGGDYEGGAFNVEGRPVTSGDAPRQSERRWVTPDYFRTLGIPLARGRFFSDRDRAGTELVAIIDTRLAREYWPDDDPVGQRIQPTSGQNWFRIVGVVEHVAQSNLAGDTDRGAMYASLYQAPVAFGSILVKTSGTVAMATSALREAVRAVDRGVPLYDVRPMELMLNESLAPRRFVMRVVGAFAAAALFLAALGLYGVISYAVAQRSREIGIRVALGAPRRSVLRMVVMQGLRLAGIGVAIGVAGAMLAGRLIESQLFGVTASDPAVIAITTCTMLTAAFAASYLPARRAMGVDPMEPLRQQ